ncbi:MAG: glycosyltransferase family 4 protein, partial [Chloroflexota bacterium]
MRIGIVTAEYPPDVGGVGDHAARLAHELAASGHAVQVVTSARRGYRPCLLTGGRGGPTGLPWPQDMRIVQRWDWRIFFALPRLARRERWDVLHIQYQPGAYTLHLAINLLPQWLRRSSCSPAIVTTFHDLRVPYVFPKAGPLRRLAVRQLARGSHGAIAVAEEDRSQLLAWTRDLRRPPVVEHIPLGNQMDASPPPDFERTAWRAHLGLPSDAQVVGHFGFVNRSMAVDELVRAIGLLAGAGRNVHLLMIGDPLGASDPTNRGYLEAVRRLIADLGLEPRVHWTGTATPEALAAWLRCLDVAALPFRDGASLRRTSIIAAWAHGAPLVTTTPSTPAEWLDEP